MNAVRDALSRSGGLAPADLDLLEINEAFASIAVQSVRDLGVDPDRVNVNGGAIALGHPVGMSGARLILSLALELRRGGGTGVAALCGGGGQETRCCCGPPHERGAPVGPPLSARPVAVSGSGRSRGRRGWRVRGCGRGACAWRS